MSDFDFDELDKAVTGAIGGAPEESVHHEEEAQRDDAPEEHSPETSHATPPAARRSSGRFMDMVHPSSDMRTHNSSASKGASRPQASSSDAPDESVATQPIAEPSDDTESQTRPLESPFLPDAKVEKRPLGGAPAVEELLMQQPEDLLLEAPDDPLLEATTMPDPIDFAVQQDVAAPEDEADTTPDDATEARGLESDWEEIKGTPFAAPLEEVSQEEVETDTTPEADVTPAPEPKPEPEVPAGPSSITQQYTEQPSSQQESGAIYDTENYHQPVAVPAKKHAGAWTVLWISLLVIIGAGAGVAVYLFVLPNL